MMEPMLIVAALLVVYIIYTTATEHISGLKESVRDIKDLVIDPCVDLFKDATKAIEKMRSEFRVSRIERAQAQKNLRI